MTSEASCESTWAKSQLARMNFVKLREKCQHQQSCIQLIFEKEIYLQKIKLIVFDYGIVPQMVQNWDKEALVPFSEWTMDQRGTNRISIKGLHDKCEITALLTVTHSGAMLPPQLLHGGKTEMCHSDIDFPSKWDIWHTKNHWLNEFVTSTKLSTHT